MKSTPRQEALRSLHAMLEETMQAQQLVSTGQAIPAIRALLRVKRLGRQSIAALLGGCLGTTAVQADEASLARLIELIGFAQQSLCPGCRSEVGKNGRRRKIVSRVTCCDLNDFIKAMADKTRHRILSLLQAGEMNESDIVAGIGLTQPTISHHMSLLRRANLVSVRHDGRCVFYRTNPACVTECCDEILAQFKICQELNQSD